MAFDAPGEIRIPPPIAAPRKTSSSAYLSIISQQTFIGCWKLNPELSKLLDIGLDQLQNSSPVKVSFYSTSQKLAL